MLVSAPYASVNWATHFVLQSSDGMEYALTRGAARMSGLLEMLLEDGDDESVIPLPNVSGRTLRHVVDYIEFHHNNRTDPIEEPLKGNLEDAITSEWDRAFLFTSELANDQALLVNLIQAANYLDIRDLLRLASAFAASTLKGQPPEELRPMRLENEFTAEEREKLLCHEAQAGNEDA